MGCEMLLVVVALRFCCPTPWALDPWVQELGTWARHAPYIDTVKGVVTSAIIMLDSFCF